MLSVEVLTLVQHKELVKALNSQSKILNDQSEILNSQSDALNRVLGNQEDQDTVR